VALDNSQGLSLSWSPSFGYRDGAFSAGSVTRDPKYSRIVRVLPLKMAVAEEEPTSALGYVIIGAKVGTSVKQSCRCMS
jgi:hypothetical protein